MNKLYIMIGCPGSGKSTYAKNHIPNTKYISRDEIRFKLVSEEEEYFSKENEVFETFINRINEGLRESVDVIADATHINTKSRLKLLASLDLDKSKTQVIAIFMRTPLHLCFERNEKRKNSRAYVPKSVIKRMHFCIVPPNLEECYGLIDIIHTITPEEEK